MICSKCQKENRRGSKFCRFCGATLSDTSVSPDTKRIRIPALNLSSLSRYYSKRLVLLILILFFVAGSGVFAAPKIKDYLAVNKILENIEGLEQASNYAAAVSMLNSADDLWMLGSQKQEVEQLKEKENDYLNYQKLFNDAKEKKMKGELEEARDLLKSIDSSFPQYALVQTELDNIQNEIETNLKEEAQRAAEAEAEAKRQARAEAQAKRQAEARAQAEAEAKEEAEARAKAEAEAKRQAEARAQAEAEAKRRAEYEKQQAQRRAQEAEQEKREQAYQAFLDEIVGVWNSLTSGIKAYNNGIDDWNYGDHDGVIINMGHAGTLFIDTESRSRELYAWSPLTGANRTAVDNLVCASENYYNATLQVLKWNIETANYYMDRGWNCYHQVGNFLRSEGR